MSIDSKIIDAVSPYVTDVKPNLYDGTSKEYCVFTYSEFPTLFADSDPDVIRYNIQVNWYLPKKVNPLTKKRNIARALHNAGFTYPSIINASDGTGQHYVFECDGIAGES